MSDPFITLVVANNIPESERKALETHWKESLVDPEYTVVLNYDAAAFQVPLPAGSNVLIVAPDIPLSELQVLRGRFDTARYAEKPEDRIVVVNYDVRIDVMTPEGTESIPEPPPPSCCAWGNPEPEF